MIAPVYGRIHLPHLCSKSVNFHDKVFLHFLQKIWLPNMKKIFVTEIYG